MTTNFAIQLQFNAAPYHHCIRQLNMFCQLQLERKEKKRFYKRGFRFVR